MCRSPRRILATALLITGLSLAVSLPAEARFTTRREVPTAVRGGGDRPSFLARLRGIIVSLWDGEGSSGDPNGGKK